MDGREQAFAEKEVVERRDSGERLTSKE